MGWSRRNKDAKDRVLFNILSGPAFNAFLYTSGNLPSGFQEVPLLTLGALKI